jgi:hypothetical protein
MKTTRTPLRMETQEDILGRCSLLEIKIQPRLENQSEQPDDAAWSSLEIYPFSTSRGWDRQHLIRLSYSPLQARYLYQRRVPFRVLRVLAEESQERYDIG